MTLTLANIQSFHAGAYSVVLSNFAGVLTNTIAVVQVDPSVVTMWQSTFDRDGEGWGVFGNLPPSFQAAGGNPGGYMTANSLSLGSYWYWVAPAQYLGNRSAAYGGLLQFDLTQSEILQQRDQADLLLSGGGMTLYFKLSKNPGTAWTSYKVALTELAGWKKGSLSGPQPTQAEMLRALASLSDIRIRGQYSAVREIGGLDNVMLLAPPTNNAVLLTVRPISGQQFLLEWPGTGIGFQLQSATSLSAPNWADLTSPPGLSNGLNSLAVPLTNSTLFYRLRRP
jgi:hypothetical protein